MIHIEEVMGTVVSVDVRDENIDPSAIGAFVAWLHEVDERFSTYKPESEISRLSSGALTLADVHKDVQEVVALCGLVFQQSGGAFDIWSHRPDGALDPSALVKGWALDRGARLLCAAGARNFCINGGGDVITAGEPEPSRAWRIGIRHPEDAGSVAAVIEANDLAIATSGLYERGAHILDPDTGRAPEGLLSVTIAGPSMTFADAYATAAFAMGVRGIEWAASLPGYEVYAITAERRARWSDGFDRLLVPNPEGIAVRS